MDTNKNMVKPQYDMIDLIASIIWFYEMENFHIGYVLDYLEVNNLSRVDNPTWCGCCHDTTDNEEWILELWKDKKLPIDKQSYECIEYIYNLLVKHSK